METKNNKSSMRNAVWDFTLIELLIVIAIIAILLRSKWLFFCYFLLFLRCRFLMRKRLTLKYRM